MFQRLLTNNICIYIQKKKHKPGARTGLRFTIELNVIRPAPRLRGGHTLRGPLMLHLGRRGNVGVRCPGPVCRLLVDCY